MKQKLQIALVCFAFVGLSLWTSWPKGEPSWSGKTVSEWLVELAPEETGISSKSTRAELMKQLKAFEDRRKVAQNAIHNIGEPALPYVLALLSDSPKQVGRLDQLAERLGRKPAEPPSKSVRISRAAYALEALGEQVRPALPILRRMLDDTNTTRNAAACLANTGRLGVPALVSGLSSSHDGTRLICISALSSVGTNASAAAPVVLAALGDSNDRIARYAMLTYSQIEANKLELVKKLVEWAHTQRTDRTNSTYVVLAMQNVGFGRRPHGPEVQPLIAELQRFAEDSEEQISAHALSALAMFGEWAVPAKARALSATRSEAKVVRRAGCQLLAAIRLEPEATVPLLVKLAQDDPDEYVRSAALQAAAAFGEAGLPFCGPLRAEVEKVTRERAEEDRIWNRTAPK